MSKKLKSVNALLFFGILVSVFLSERYLDEQATQIVVFSYVGLMVVILLIRKRIRRARRHLPSEESHTDTSVYTDKSRYDTSSLWSRSTDSKDDS